MEGIHISYISIFILLIIILFIYLFFHYLREKEEKKKEIMEIEKFENYIENNLYGRRYDMKDEEIFEIVTNAERIYK